MADNNFPSNSVMKKEDEPSEKIAVGTVSQKKKSTGAKIKESLINGDGRTIKDYIIFDVMLPALKDMLSSAIQTASDMFIYGESRGRRSSSSAPTTRINYNKMYSNDRIEARRASDAYSIDILEFEERGDADRVLDALREEIDLYGRVSVFKYYDLCGKTCPYTYKNYGWNDLDFVSVQRQRDGSFIIDLPRVQQIKSN